MKLILNILGRKQIYNFLYCVARFTRFFLKVILFIFLFPLCGYSHFYVANGLSSKYSPREKGYLPMKDKLKRLTVVIFLSNFLI